MNRIITVLLIIISYTASSQNSQDTIVLVEKIMDKYKSENPGAEMVISRYGKIIYDGIRGMADLEHNIPLTKTSKTEAGSVSKQFTAACILLLEQQGKLSINDDIRKYLPEIRDYGHPIRIYHLLHHTSGLKDWGAVIEFSGWPRTTRAYTNDDALHIMANQKTVNNIPGDEYIYSNSNYTALTMIVKRVSGMSLEEFTNKFIFEPAGMKNTEWRDSYRRIVPGRAISYVKKEQGYETLMPNEDTHGHGGLLTTAEDLVRWVNFYSSGKFGNPSLFEKQVEIKPFNSGKKNRYAAGLNTDSINGWRAISHTGNTAAYIADLEYFPDLGLTFAFLSNTTELSLSEVPFAIRNLYVKNLISKPVQRNITTDSTVSWKKFITYAGAYKNKNGDGFIFTAKEDGLYMNTNSGPLPVISKNKLAVGRGQLIFPGKKSGTLQFVNAAGDTLLFYNTEMPGNGEKYFKQYTGTYFSDETESYIYLELQNGKLVVYPRKGLEKELAPVYKDGFNYPGTDACWFVRDKQGIITHFYISVGRARGIEFKKVK